MKVLFAALLALSAYSTPALAEGHSRDMFEEEVHTSFSHGPVSFDIKAKACTVVTVHEVRKSKVSHALFVRYTVEVYVYDFDTRVGPYKPMFKVLMDNQTLKVDSEKGPGGEGDVQTASIIQSIDTAEDDLKNSIWAGLLNRGTMQGTGIELGTVFSQDLEKLSPGIQNSFMDHLTRMAYTDRLESISEEIAYQILNPPSSAQVVK